MNKAASELDVVILLSTYNGEKYLNQQLESIANQTYNGNVVLVVRDDGSKDNTISIIHSWENRINIIFIDDDDNLGAANSFWKLLTLAPRAKFYAFVDQDDIWHKDKLAIAVNKLKNNLGKTLWFSNYRLINDVERVLSESVNETAPNLSIASELVCGMAQGCAMVFTNELREFCINHEWDYIPMHDIVIISCAFMVGNVIYEDTPYFDYRVHDDNVIANQGKNLIGKLKGTYKLWIEKRNETSKFADTLYKIENSNICEDEKKYLAELSKTRHSLKSRYYILKSPYTQSIYKNGLRSFKIRTVLGLI